VAEGCPAAVGWVPAVVGTCAGVVGASAGDVVMGALVGALVGTLVGKRVLVGVDVSVAVAVAVAVASGCTAVVLVAFGRMTGAVGFSTLVAGLVGRLVAAAGRTMR